MTRAEESLTRIIDCGIIAIVRSGESEGLIEAVQAIRAGGIKVIEFAMTTSETLKLLEQARTRLSDDVMLGVGTVLDAETARLAILAGAELIVTPTLSPEVVVTCHRYGVVVVAGALTPTEVMAAWTVGAHLVKVFPARLGGPQYIRDLLAPLPQVRLVPTGGVGLDQVEAYLRAGAAAVGVGGNLVDKRAVAEGNWQRLTALAQSFREVVERAR